MALYPIFGVKTLLLLVLPVFLAAVILGAAGGRGGGFLKKQPVAWAITALMIVLAVFIGLGKAPANNIPAPAPDNAPTAVPPNVVPATPVEYYVRDDAAVLSNRTEDELNERNIRLVDKYNVLVGVATCNYGGDDLGSFAQKYFEDMGLGGYDMLVVLDISGDNYWLYTGDDVAWDFSDETCADYTWTYMEDEFARGNYDTAVLNLTEALEAWYELYYM